MSSQFDSCPICKKPMTCSETLILAGNVCQHYDCSLDSSSEMKAATEPAAEHNNLSETKRGI